MADGAEGILLLRVLVNFDGGDFVTVDAMGAAVLMKASPVFHKMLTHEMQEKIRGEIDLPGKDPDEFDVLLKFLMPGTSRQQKLTAENVGFLRRWCDEYMIESIRDECVEFIRTAEPSQHILLEAKALNMNDRVRECIDELLASGQRDWTPCYADHALMQAIIERTMQFLETHVDAPSSIFGEPMPIPRKGRGRR